MGAAILEALSARLLAANSATRTLEAWCAERGIGRGSVWARILPATMTAPPEPAVLAQLSLELNETVRFRHVDLMCGPTALSRAVNWYVPERLLPAMRHALDTTEIPFGVVVAPLRPTRRTIHVAVNAASLTHHAVVLSDTGQPLAVVHERYHAVLAVP